MFPGDMMPIFDTPVTTDAQSLRRVLAQKIPVLLLLHGQKKDAPIDDAMRKLAKKYAGELLVVTVDAMASPDVHVQYGKLTLPALIALTGGNHGRSIKSQVASVRPADVRAHAEHLMHDVPLPQASAEPASRNNQPVRVSDKTWREEVLKSKQLVLVDFWADWCGPCKTIAPYIDQLARDYAGKVKVVKLDTDRNPVISRRYDIRSIPTFMLFENGQLRERSSGANPGAIKRMVDNALKS